MNNNSDTIEQKAVNYVNQAILDCPHLAPYIVASDTTPLWDGTVYVYNTTEHANRNLRGRVPVQVKGECSSDLTKEKIKYSILVSDLESYLAEGGVFFIVVRIKGKEHRIYYANLLPYDIAKALKNKEIQKSISIEFIPLPVDNTTEITNIFLFFLTNRPLQTGISSKSVLSLKDLENQGVAISNLAFGVTCVGVKPGRFDEYISSHPFYIYAQLKGTESFIPIDKPIETATSRVVQAPVCINNVEVYPFYLVNYWRGENSFCFGKGFKLSRISVDIGSKYRLEYQTRGTLSERIKDCETLITLLSTLRLTINGIEILLNSPLDQEEKLAFFKTMLESLKRIGLLLNELNVKDELSFDSLTDTDRFNLNRLIEGVIYHKNIVLRNLTNQFIVGVIKIANLTILISGQKQNDSPNSYSVCSFSQPFSVKYTQNAGTTDEVEFEGSQYLLLNKDQYVAASNLDYDVVASSLTSFACSDMLRSQTVNSMLQVLLAYDESKKEGLLNLADSLCDWIIQNTSKSDEHQSAVNVLNHLQIAKRSRQLKLEELAKLAYVCETSSEVSILCGAHILLEQYEEALANFRNLPLDVQYAFLDYPICNLWVGAPKIDDIS